MGGGVIVDLAKPVLIHLEFYYITDTDTLLYWVKICRNRRRKWSRRSIGDHKEASLTLTIQVKSKLVCMR